MTMSPSPPSEPDTPLRIDCGVEIPPEHVATIATMHRAAGAGRAAIRAVRLGETEPLTIFVPLGMEMDHVDAE